MAGMSFPTARDPILSLFQSAAAAQPDPALHAAAAHIVAAAPQPPPPGTTCAALGLAYLRAVASGDPARVTAAHDRLQYSECDPLWGETLLTYAARFLPAGQALPIPYRRHTALTDFVLTASAPSLRIALLSDWGTGNDQARRVAALMAAQKPDCVIHLGDIYYSGTPEECARNFLTPLRAVLPATPVFTLCGNHDTYSGGQGYYGLLDTLGQPASYFCLRSPDLSWQILAADTGLNDRNPFDETAALTLLDPQEEAWHAHQLTGFPGQTILLSHHQPFSAYRQIGPAGRHSPINPNLMASHARLSRSGPITAWFWGHEHRLALYAPYEGVAAGRNIGYGAVPRQAERDVLAGLNNPPALAVATDLDVVDGAYTHGFALLDTAPDRLDVSYWALTHPDGPIHRETFTADPTSAPQA